MRSPVTLRVPPLPEENPCKYRIVHRGLKGDTTKALSLSATESTTPNISASHVKLLILIKEWGCKVVMDRLIDQHLAFWVNRPLSAPINSSSFFIFVYWLRDFVQIDQSADLIFQIFFCVLLKNIYGLDKFQFSKFCVRSSRRCK